MSKQTGFTLVEIAIVMTIIAVLMAGVLGGQRYINDARALDVVETVKGIIEASSQFRSRYKYWPGDFPAAHDQIPAIARPSVCDIAVGTAGIGNGVVDTPYESRCAIEQLFLADLIKAVADPADANGLHRILTSTGNQLLFTITSDGGAPARNILQLTNVLCSTAQRIDQKMDNDELATGRVTSPACANPDATTTLSIRMN